MEGWELRDNRGYTIRMVFLALIILLSIQILGEIVEVVIFNNIGRASENEIELVGDQFIKDLFSWDKDRLEKVTLGTVRFNVAANKDGVEANQWELVNVESKGRFIGDNLGEVYSTVEYKDKLGEANTIFYSIQMLKRDGEWRIYRLKEGEPQIEGEFTRGLLAGTWDTGSVKEELEKVFLAYVGGLLEDDYKGASSELISIARRLHDDTGQFIRGANLFEGKPVEIVSTRMIHENENIAIYEFKYSKGETILNSMVHFYLTGQGWKIYDVVQL